MILKEVSEVIYLNGGEVQYQVEKVVVDLSLRDRTINMKGSVKNHDHSLLNEGC